MNLQDDDLRKAEESKLASEVQNLIQEEPEESKEAREKQHRKPASADDSSSSSDSSGDSGSAGPMGPKGLDGAEGNLGPAGEPGPPGLPGAPWHGKSDADTMVKFAQSLLDKVKAIETVDDDRTATTEKRIAKIEKELGVDGSL